MTDPWGDLVVLAERERELALAGQWEDVAELSEQRLRLAQGLGQAPPSARGPLLRLSELQTQIDASLVSAHAFTARELGELRRRRTAVHGYGAGLPGAPARVDSLR
jgi:hypothetical protein